jgi:hypothetical protein
MVTLVSSHMKLVEQRSGSGMLIRDGAELRAVFYSITRYQGFVEQSGLPIPGLHRIEGSLDFEAFPVPPDWLGTPLALRLEDGRVLAITIEDSSGRVVSEGHGPTKCLCC